MRRALFAMGAVGLLAAMAPPAFAATTVGQAAPSSATPAANCSGLVGVQTASGAGAPSYTIPSDGVLTGYTTRATSFPAAATQLVVFHHTAGVNYTVVGSSDMNHLTPSALDHFPARISVLSGDLLGIQVPNGSNWCHFTGVPGDAHSFSPPFDPQPGTVFTPNFATTGQRWNIEATLEADADHDGFGDETQDQCPTVATTQGPCPVAPVTPVTKSKCKHKTKKHKRSAAIAKKCKKKHHH